MLGKHHLALTSLTILPILMIFILFWDNNLIYFGISLFTAGTVASLIPDSDCNGKATISYKYPIIDKIMRYTIGKPMIKIFNLLIIKGKISVEHKIDDEHRGIIHSPIGILISSISLSLIILILMLIFDLFDFIVLFGIFIGLILGQFLHLFQDSMTISGINWKFPFGTKILKGKIKTFNKKDKRPKVFEFILILFFIMVTLVSIFYQKINRQLFLFLVIASLIILWYLFFLISKK